jgi:hypothetical protein
MMWTGVAATLFVGGGAVVLTLVLARVFPNIPQRAWAVLFGTLGLAAAGFAVLRALDWIDPLARGSAVGAALTCPLFAVAAVRTWRGFDRQRLRIVFELGGIGGVAVAAAGVIAFVLQGTSGLVIGSIAVLGLLALAVKSVATWERVLTRIRSRLVEASEWSEAADGPDDVAERSTMGLWTGLRVWVKRGGDGLSIRAFLARWPNEVSLARTVSTVVTGDTAFDSVVQLSGNDTAWRPLLMSEVRAELFALCRDAACSIENGQLELEVRDEDQVEVVLDRCAALAALLRDPHDDVMTSVFEQSQREPIAGVRSSNYRWLVAHDWNVQAVYRAASSDPDPAIAAWGAQYIAPNGGAFR